MKKLLTFMVVVTCAMVTQAAAFSWGSGTSVLVDDKGTKLTSLDSGSIVLVLLGSDTEKFTDATVLDTGTINTSKNPGKVTGKYNFVYDTEGSLENGNILAVLFKDDSGNFSKLRNADNTADVYKEYTVAGLGDNTWTRTDYQFASENFQAPVPEPTSALLLIVGGALMALRRKQK